MKILAATILAVGLLAASPANAGTRVGCSADIPRPGHILPRPPHKNIVCVHPVN